MDTEQVRDAVAEALRNYRHQAHLGAARFTAVYTSGDDQVLVSLDDGRLATVTVALPAPQPEGGQS